jgi:hypothetical protein
MAESVKKKLNKKRMSICIKKKIELKKVNQNPRYNFLKKY